ncbi:MAG: response regulator, partial [Pseudomonadota bacterium]
MSSAPPGRTVVLVEDNPADVELMREALAQSPRPPVVRHFTAGGDALAHLRAAADVDLVLLDINLPGTTSRPL